MIVGQPAGRKGEEEEGMKRRRREREREEARKE
jgi:hypothetical protein